jgi:hypothetical protein
MEARAAALTVVNKSAIDGSLSLFQRHQSRALETVACPQSQRTRRCSMLTLLMAVKAEQVRTATFEPFFGPSSPPCGRKYSPERRHAQEEDMPTQAEIEAAARVLCRVAYFQLPANDRTCSADQWPDVDAGKPEKSLQNAPYKRWETFSHEARLALEAAEYVRSNGRRA